MRILIATSERGMRGGERQMIALTGGLAELGHEVAVVLPACSEAATPLRGIVPVEHAGFESPPMGTPFRLARLIRRMKPDIIHAQSSRAHTHLRLATLLPGDFPPIVVSRRVAFPVSKGPWGCFKYRRGISHYIPISRAAAASLSSAGVPDAMMTVVPSGVDVSRYEAAGGEPGLLDRWGIREEAFLVGTVAAFEREKGHRFLIEAAGIVCKRYPACTFVLIGSGRLETKLRVSAARSGLEKRIVFAGLDTPLEKMLPLFDLYVLPSVAEGLSSALIAAMSAGIPIVASRTGGIPELLGDGIGLMVPAGDTVALSDAIIELVSDADRRREMAGRARIAARRYDISHMISGTEAVYRSIIEKNGKNRISDRSA